MNKSIFFLFLNYCISNTVFEYNRNDITQWSKLFSGKITLFSGFIVLLFENIYSSVNLNGILAISFNIRLILFFL